MSKKDLDKGRGNGTTCIIVGVQFKSPAPNLHWMNWDGRKANTVFTNDFGWLEYIYDETPLIIELENTVKKTKDETKESSSGAHLDNNSINTNNSHPHQSIVSSLGSNLKPLLPILQHTLKIAT